MLFVCVFQFSSELESQHRRHRAEITHTREATAQQVKHYYLQCLHQLVNTRSHDHNTRSHYLKPRSHDLKPRSHDHKPRSHDLKPRSHDHKPSSHPQTKMHAQSSHTAKQKSQIKSRDVTSLPHPFTTSHATKTNKKSQHVSSSTSKAPAATTSKATSPEKSSKKAPVVKSTSKFVALSPHYVAKTTAADKRGISMTGVRTIASNKTVSSGDVRQSSKRNLFGTTSSLKPNSH